MNGIVRYSDGVGVVIGVIVAVITLLAKVTLKTGSIGVVPKKIGANKCHCIYLLGNPIEDVFLVYHGSL